jgi:hypothetical protein
MKDMVAMIDGTVLVNVHTQDQCAGQSCCIHNPSQHHMALWPHHWDREKQMLRECPHGYLHPDPDDLAFKRHMHANVAARRALHRCDGCCQPVAQKELTGRG